MKKIIILVLVICSALGIYYSKGIIAGDTKEMDQVTENPNEGNNKVKRITLEINGKKFLADLENNPSTKALLKQMPLKVKMLELNGNEKHYPLDKSLPTNSKNVGEIKVGDIKLYGDNELVLFYRNFPTSYSYTNLGKIVDTTGLAKAVGKGNVEVHWKEDGKGMKATRTITNGTKIKMHFGDTVIPGILKDTQTSRELISRMPFTVRLSKYAHDFCGVIKPLPYDEKEVHNGWQNGDIDFASDGNYFTILYAGEESSKQYGYQINIGIITCDLEEMNKLEGSYDVLVEVDK